MKSLRALLDHQEGIKQAMIAALARGQKTFLYEGFEFTIKSKVRTTVYYEAETALGSDSLVCPLEVEVDNL